MNTGDRILVAGIGNIFFGDDAFGIEVVRLLQQSRLPPEVEIVDFGIRGYDLAYTIMRGYLATILVDAASRGNPPGTIYLIEPDEPELAALENELPDGHSLGPVDVLRLVKSLGGQIGRLYLVCCEPEILESEDGRIGLSHPVQEALPGAVDMIHSLIEELRHHAK